MRNSHKEHSLSTNQFYSDYGINTADKLMSKRIPNVPSRRTADKHIEENSAENNSVHSENPVARGLNGTKMVLLPVHHITTRFRRG